MGTSNMIEIAERTDELMVVRTMPLFAYLWSLLLPSVYTVLFLSLFLMSLTSKSDASRADWGILILAAIFIPLGFVYSFFICRKLNVITFDRKEGQLCVKPFFASPFMKQPATYELDEVKMLLYRRAPFLLLPCLYVQLKDDTRIALLDTGGFNLKFFTVFKEAGLVHEDIAHYIGAPYVNAFANYWSWGFRKF